MKKLLSIMLVILVLTTLLASCGTPVNTNLDTDTNTDTTSDTSQEPVDTSIKVENQDKYIKVPSEIITYYNNRYPSVLAGRYYGEDFKNVNQYGAYYRIITSYSEFSELTQYGEMIPEIAFEDSFILVVFNYSQEYKYGITTYFDLAYSNRYEKLTMQYRRTGSELAPKMIDNITVEYLLIPNEDYPEGASINGYLNLEWLIPE